MLTTSAHSSRSFSGRAANCVFGSNILLQSHGVYLLPSFVYKIFSIHSPSIIALGEDEAPNPAEGLDPKVVEVYTKYVPSSSHIAIVSLRIIFFSLVGATESASSYAATAPAHFQNRSKSYPLSQHGRASLRSPRPSSGRPRLRMQRRGYSSRI
jgi:hypothetical protein